MTQEDLVKSIINQYDEEGRIILEMVVLDDSEFLTKYCGTFPLINEEVASYISTSLKRVPGNNQVTLNIYSNEIDDKEKIIYEDAIKNYYVSDSIELARDIWKNNIGAFGLLFVGIIIISLLIILRVKNLGEVWQTILEIVGWVFIWEATDKYLFVRRGMKKQLLRNKKVIEAKINFLPLVTPIDENLLNIKE